jgi:hypothetical protein
MIEDAIRLYVETLAEIRFAVPGDNRGTPLKLT